MHLCLHSVSECDQNLAIKKWFKSGLKNTKVYWSQESSGHPKPNYICDKLTYKLMCKNLESDIFMWSRSKNNFGAQESVAQHQVSSCNIAATKLHSAPSDLSAQRKKKNSSNRVWCDFNAP